MRSTNVAQPDGARLVTVSGEVDIATASELRHAVHDACGYLPLYIQLDLQAVTFIDASGLRGLWDAALELRGSGVPFRVSPVSDVVRRVLEVSESATWLSWDAGELPDANLGCPAVDVLPAAHPSSASISGAGNERVGHRATARSDLLTWSKRSVPER